MANEQRLPLLLTLDGHESADHYFYDLLENRYKTNSLPFLSWKSVVCSAYGWLVLVERVTGESCLWNPTSMEIIQLPTILEGLRPYHKCFLSKPPTEPDCFVALNQFYSMHVCKVGDDAFVEIHCEDKGYYVDDMVYFKGVTYALIEPLDKLYNKFVTIHMVGGTLEMRPLLIDDKLPWKVPRPMKSSMRNINYLMESPCGNELLLVSMHIFFIQFNSRLHFRVFRVDVGKMECEELENLDGRTVFLSFYGNGFCRYSEAFGAAIRPNSIYYTNSYGMAVYVYDLDDRSTTSFLPCTDVDYSEATSDSYWVDLPAIPDSSGLE